MVLLLTLFKVAGCRYMHVDGRCALPCVVVDSHDYHVRFPAMVLFFICFSLPCPLEAVITAVNQKVQERKARKAAANGTQDPHIIK